MGSIVVLTGDRPLKEVAAALKMGLYDYYNNYMDSSYYEHIDKYAQLASDNQSSTTKCNISIDMRDMQSDIKQGIVSAFDLSDSFEKGTNLNVPVVLGPISSGYALTVNPVIDAFDLIQFSSTATSTFLTSYPNFYRSVPSDAVQGRALVELCHHFGWHSIGILYVNNYYGSSLEQAIIKYANAYSIETQGFSFIDGDNVTITDAIASMKKSQLLIFVLIIFPSDTDLIAQTLINNGMGMYPYYYLGTDSFLPHDFIRSNDWNSFYGGMIGTCPWSPSINDTFLSKYPENVVQSINKYQSLYHRWHSYYEMDENNTFGLPYPGLWAPYAYDNFLAVVNALNLYFENATDTDLHNNISPSRFHDILKTVSFIGLTGEVVFSELGDRDDGLMSFCGFDDDGISYTIGFTVSNGDSDATVEISEDVISWPIAFNKKTPKTEYYSYNGIPTSLRIVAWTLALLSMLFALFLMFCLWFYKKRPIVRASQWALSCLMGVGVCIAYVCIILFGIDEKNVGNTFNEHNWMVLCNARMVLLNLAFCSTFGPLFFKVYRIKIIFRIGTSNLNVVTLTDTRMACYNLLYVLVELVLAVIIVAAVPYSRKYNIEESHDIDLFQTQLWGSCATQLPVVYAVLLVLPKLVLGVTCIVISISVYSSVSMMKFNEGLQVLMSVVISIVLISMLVAILGVITINSEVTAVFFYGLFTLVLLLVCNFSIIIMLLPRIVAIWENQEDEYNQDHDAMFDNITKYISRLSRAGSYTMRQHSPYVPNCNDVKQTTPIPERMYNLNHGN